MDTKDKRKLTFQFFNEIGIIQQLATTAFNRRLPDGLHVSHFSILNHLIRLGDGKTPLELSDAFQVTKGTMTHTLGALSKRDFIKLSPHPSDGRSKIVFLTDSGRTFHASAIESLAPLMHIMEHNFDLNELANMLPKLQEVRAILDKHRDV
ncbi:MAG: MarR family transcriptional regulator [Hyphomicrobiales bacterium]